MERVGHITLREEVFLKDAYEIADWLENEEVTRYLTEGNETSREIRRSLMYTSCPVVTHMFCSSGKFFIIDMNGKAIGYSRLIPKSTGYEVVIVIGNQNMWNKGYGQKVLNEIMKEAFFNLRSEMIIAKIKHGNEHSRHLFEKFGFSVVHKSESCSVLNMRIEEFMKKAA